MELRKVVRLGLASALIGAGLVVGAAYAQEAKESPPNVNDNATMRREVKLSPEEQVKEAESILAGLDMVGKNVRKQLEKAREDRDVVKALCLSDKLTQIDVAKKSASERLDALRQAVARQDPELSTHEYTILVVLKERGAQLAAEANQCIGVEAGFVGESAVTVDVDPNLPTQDPSEYPSDDTIISQPPGCVSCIQ